VVDVPFVQEEKYQGGRKPVIRDDDDDDDDDTWDRLRLSPLLLGPDTGPFYQPRMTRVMRYEDGAWME
jgi:hypothetical protein